MNPVTSQKVLRTSFSTLVVCALLLLPSKLAISQDANAVNAELPVLQLPVLQDAVVIAKRYNPSKGPHPDFILPSIDGGDAIQLSKYRGKKVLLLHFASW